MGLRSVMTYVTPASLLTRSSDPRLTRRVSSWSRSSPRAGSGTEAAGRVLREARAIERMVRMFMV